jgi:pimeloyl-ACP methyl ester carboxylesterase
VVCPDIVGRGQSTYFGDPAMYSFETYFTCLGALSKYAGDKNHFIATSWGGAVVIYFLSTTGVRADKLVLNDVGLRGGPAIDQAIAFIAADSRQAFDALDDARAYVRRTRDHLSQLSEELWQGYLENKIRFSDGKFRLAYDPAVTDLLLTITGRSFDLMSLLQKIPSEILLLYGAESRSYEPAVVADLMRRFPTVSCVADLRPGHRPSLMSYDQALMIGGFLSS